ncbi:hypothetical protein [Bosea sp. PAMC 26642]|uniref:hypothetical protein n=1 Tax=Bosea sp. (strain PAMC 26642) TaxID=1792307 RepID=UPI0012E8D24B|nr:hypothetical protein [Bosea sp. PAMC 26642]
MSVDEGIEMVSPPLKSISVREFARRAGCDKVAVQRKVKSGHLPVFSDGTVDPRHVDMDWRIGVSPLPPLGTVPGDTETLEEAAARIVIAEGVPWSKPEAERVKENYAAKLRQLDYDRESGLVAEIEDVAIAVATELSLVRNKLLNIGSKVAPRIAVMRSAEEIKAMIDAEVVLALEELSLDAPGATDFDTLRESLRLRFGEPSQ